MREDCIPLARQETEALQVTQLVPGLRAGGWRSFTSDSGDRVLCTPSWLERREAPTAFPCKVTGQRSQRE